MIIYIAESLKYNISIANPSREYLKSQYHWAEDLTIYEQEYREYLLSMLPDEFRQPVFHMAWSQGHSAGEYEVDNILESIVIELLPAITKFENRIIAKRIDIPRS